MDIPPWSKTVLKGVIMAAARFSGVVYIQRGCLEDDEGLDPHLKQHLPEPEVGGRAAIRSAEDTGEVRAA